MLVDDDELNDVRDAWREAGRDPADLEFLEIEDLLSPRTFGAETALIVVKDRRTGRSKIYPYASNDAGWPQTVANDLVAGIFS